MHVPVRGVLKPGAESVRVTPRNRGAQSHAIHTRKRFDAAYRFLVEVDNLIGRPSVLDYGHVHGEDAARVEAGSRRLEREQRSEQHAGAG